MGRCWGRGAGNTWRQSQTPASTCLHPAAPPLAADPARLPSGPRVPHVRLFGFPGRSAPSAPSSVRTSKPVSQAETPTPHTAQGARRCWTRALPAKVAGDAQGKPEKPNRAPAMLAGPLAHLPPTTARGAGCPGKRSCPGHRGPRGALTQQCSQPGDDSAAHLRAGKPRLAAEDGGSGRALREPAPLPPQTRLSGSQPSRYLGARRPAEPPGARAAGFLSRPGAHLFLISRSAGSQIPALVTQSGSPGQAAAGRDIIQSRLGAGRRERGWGPEAAPTSHGASVSRLHAQPSRAQGSLNAGCPGAWGVEGG